MQGTSDDLIKPLGQNRPQRRSPRRLGAILTVLASATVLGIGAVLVGAALYGDPRGGRPFARVDVAAPAPEKTAPSPAAEREHRGGTGRREAEQVEEESGVKVVRGGGASAPSSVVVEVPAAARTGLSAVPDARLAEASRFGILPKIGPDGAKAVEVYARPVVRASGDRAAVGRIAIVVGGLGLARGTTEEAIDRLPAAVSLAFAPYGADLERDAVRARQAGHEILLQLPMEPFDYPDSDPGPRTLTVTAKPGENTENLRWALGRLPGYVGIVNYMGGKLTADEKALGPVLREIEQRGLGILDDGTSSRSRMSAVAGEAPSARGELVVDATPRADLIDAALARLETLAKSGRPVVATASALPVSIERIAAWAAGLEERGMLLVPVSSAMTTRRDSASR